MEEKEEKDKIKEEMIHEFLEILISKNLFNKDEFFTGSQNLKISLLIKLYENKKIQKSDKNYYDNIITVLDAVNKDLGGEIKKSKLE